MDDYEDVWQWWCQPCQKWGMVTRRAARRVRRLMHEPGMRAYPCPRGKGWHNGHNPLPVRRGLFTAAEWYALPPRRRAEVMDELQQEANAA